MKPGGCIGCDWQPGAMGTAGTVRDGHGAGGGVRGSAGSSGVAAGTDSATNGTPLWSRVAARPPRAWPLPGECEGQGAWAGVGLWGGLMLRRSPAPGAGPGRAGAAPAEAGAAPAGPGATVAMDRMSWLKADLSPGTGQMPLLLCPIWPSWPPRCQVTLLPRCGDVFAVPHREPPVQPRGEGRDTLWGPRGLTLWRGMRSGFVPAHAGWSQSSQCGCMGSPCLRPRWPRGVKLGAEPGGARSSNSVWWLHGGSGDPRTGTGRQHCPAACGLRVTGQPEPAAREGDGGGGPGVPGRVTPAPTAGIAQGSLML